MFVDGFKVREHGTHEDRSLENFINCLNGCQLKYQESSSLFHRVRRSGKSLELVPAGIETENLVSEKERKETESKISNEENIEVTNKPIHKTTLSDILRSRSGTTYYMSVTEGSDSSQESSDQSSQELNDDEDVVGHDDISSSWNCHHLCLRNSNIFG
ncbi:unnamed protein product [Mytilus coruscus]|uniref:Uncharacterized protein n=1 Tax=Mytilus coruscus TaxID=42192 RepID=A0A6J8A3K2_MYTCO|nr:unnamed protein product [Mytilus coruscus]